MSQANVEIMRSAYAVLAEQGVEAVLAFTDPQFEATTPPSLASEPDTYRGHEGVRRYFGSFGDSMDGVYFEGQEFTSVGDKVLVDTKLHARGRTTGIETEQRAFLVWTLREGMVTRVETFRLNRWHRRSRSRCRRRRGRSPCGPCRGT
jgi:ketosteroid isomerase-like protein